MDTGKEIDFDRYMSRISVRPDELAGDAGTLTLLQKQHLLSVPFENLDIHWKRPITINAAKFYKKIVGERRGGFCYELNGLYGELLTHLGFKIRTVSARVFNGTGHGPEFDHAAIIVSIDGNEYLTDVGFGDFITEPLRLVIDEEQRDPSGTFAVRRFDDDYLEVARRDGDDWKSQYIFKDVARDLSEFGDMCDFQQFSAESHFTKGKVCSLMTERGRKTLTDTKFIVTSNGEKSEVDVGTGGEFETILLREFGISRNT